MTRLFILAAAAAAVLPLSVLPAEAVDSSSARQICVKAAAEFHSELAGNVQVRKVAKQGSGYEVNLQVKGVESNCMVTSGGKVRYLN